MEFSRTAADHARQKLGISLNELAKRSALSRGQINLLMNFQCPPPNPTLRTVASLAQALEVNFIELLRKT